MKPITFKEYSDILKKKEEEFNEKLKNKWRAEQFDSEMKNDEPMHSRQSTKAVKKKSRASSVKSVNWLSTKLNEIKAENAMRSSSVNP